MAERVVAVDDNREILEMMQAILAGEGYEVIVCAEGRRAYEIIRLTRPAVVLLDLLMPDLNGWAVLEQLYDDPETRRIPIIISTAAVREVERAREFLRRRNYQVLLRPFDFDALLQAIESALDAQAATG